MRALVGMLAAITAATIAVSAQTKTYALPAAATEGTSVVNHMPDFMVIMDEGGSVPSEPGATCDNRPAGNSKSGVGFHLEHYFAGAKATFDQKVTILREHMGLRQAVQAEAGTAKVVMESLDGVEAAYAVVAQDCVADAHPSATRIQYYARLIRGTTYADIQVGLYASGPDAARTYAREIIRKIEALKFASVK